MNKFFDVPIKRCWFEIIGWLNRSLKRTLFSSRMSFQRREIIESKGREEISKRFIFQVRTRTNILFSSNRFIIKKVKIYEKVWSICGSFKQMNSFISVIFQSFKFQTGVEWGWLIDLITWSRKGGASSFIDQLDLHNEKWQDIFKQFGASFWNC